jgi:hypothetical protein
MPHELAVQLSHPLIGPRVDRVVEDMVDGLVHRAGCQFTSLLDHPLGEGVLVGRSRLEGNFLGLAPA